MTWNEIYEAASDKGYGDPELTRKDIARYEVVCFVEENFGFNLESEREKNVIECVEDWIDDYVERYNISFDDEGHIIGHSVVELKDKAAELVMFYDELPDRRDKDFDTLDIAMRILKEINENKFKLRIYKKSGVEKGNLDREEFFVTKEQMDARYNELFIYDDYSLNPAAYQKVKDKWTRLAGY